MCVRYSVRYFCILDDGIQCLSGCIMFIEKCNNNDVYFYSGVCNCCEAVILK